MNNSSFNNSLKRLDEQISKLRQTVYDFNVALTIINQNIEKAFSKGDNDHAYKVENK